jgi:small-conductance mechanosensitive channel
MPTPTPSPTPITEQVTNPTFWSSVLVELGNWGVKLLQVAITLVVCFLIAWLLRLLIRRIVRRIVSGVKSAQGATDTDALIASPVATVRVVQRTRTLGTVLNNIVNVVVGIIAIVLVVNIINPNIVGSFALLTAAIGAGLGFGAQQLVQDILNGLLMVVEDQLGVGDVVSLPSAGVPEMVGMVEVVGIRTTQARDVNGTLWYLHNGQILRLGNMSKGWERVITDLAVPYDSDIDAVQDRMLRVALSMSNTPRWRSRIVEKPEVWGIQSISAGAVVLRVVVKTRAGAKDDVARELRRRLKTAFDDMEITLPSLSSLVLIGAEGADSIVGAHPPRTKPTPVVTTEAIKPKRGRKRWTVAHPPAEPESPRPKTQDAPPRPASTANPSATRTHTAQHPQSFTRPKPDSTDDDKGRS